MVKLTQQLNCSGLNLAYKQVTTHDFAQLLKSPEYQPSSGFIALGISQRDEPVTLTAYYHDKSELSNIKREVTFTRGSSPHNMQLGYITRGINTDYTPDQAQAWLMEKAPANLILIQPMNGVKSIGQATYGSIKSWQLEVASIFLKDLVLQNRIRSLLTKPIKLTTLNPIEDRFAAAKSGKWLDRFQISHLASITDDRGRTPLHYAAKSGTLPSIQGGVTVLQLHQTKATPDICCNKVLKSTALHEAIEAKHLDQLKDKLTVDFIIQEKAWDLLRPLLQSNQTTHVSGDWSKLSSHLDVWSTTAITQNPEFPILKTFIEKGMVHLLYPKGTDKVEQAQQFWNNLTDDAKTAFKAGVKETHRGYVPQELKDLCTKMDIPIGVGLPSHIDQGVSCS